MPDDLSGESRRQRLSLVVLVLVVAIGSLAGLFLLIRLTTPPSLMPEPPDPNGFDDLLEVGRKIESSPFGNLDPGEMDERGLAQSVSENQEALALARQGLLRESLVPIRFDSNEINEAIQRIGALRSLGRLLLAEGHLAELQEEPAVAASSYIDTVRLGGKAGRGGLLIDVLVGFAIETQGIVALAKTLESLPAESLTGAIAILAEADRRAEPFEDAARRELQYAREAHGLWNGLLVRFSSTMREQLEISIDAARLAHHRVTAARRLLLLEVALKLHRERLGDDPGTLAELVPEFLPAVPPDPYTDGPWIYRPRPGEPALLYSVGPDRVDDGGRALDWSKPEAGGDLTIETLRR